MARSMKDARAYHQWVYESFEKWLLRNGATLEIGAGHGEYSELLLGLDGKLTVTDIDSEAVEIVDRRFAGMDDVTVIRMDGIEPERLEMVFENIVALNIMEHIEDDLGFARGMYEVLKPDGRAIVFVPAFPLLYSEIDAQAGHHRRYTSKGVREVLENAGFSVISMRYFNFVGFFGWYLNKLTGSGVDSEATNFQVKLFNYIVPIVRKLEMFNWLCGQSIIAVAEKKGG